MTTTTAPPPPRNRRGPLRAALITCVVLLLALAVIVSAWLAVRAGLARNHQALCTIIRLDIRLETSAAAQGQQVSRALYLAFTQASREYGCHQ